MLGLPIPNAWITNLQCSDSRFPMLGLTIPNARIPDSQGENAACRGASIVPRKQKWKKVDESQQIDYG
jgi:hypothetical protein